MLAPFGMRVALLTGGMKAAARRTTLAAIRNDEADLVVGTHAILSEGVEFARLGLAVIDEQHRFGVRQRGMLAEKAANPHLLVMSATPIPRTLGLLIYGDLDISILDELPPGRTPVKTRCITGKKRRDLYHFLDQEIGRGRQVYLVCPAIEDTPDGGLNAVKSYYEDIAKALLPERRVGLMHGKLKPKEKAAVMEDFKAGRLDALVSTTVIEVGVDVPNASVMVIENAERYGLSARPAHPADRRPDERHPHPARCAGGSRCHAGRRPAAGSAGARTAGTAGAADVRESRSHELIRRFFAHKQQQMQKPLHGWCSGPCYRTERFACRSPMLITSQNTQRLLVESWVSL